MPFTSPLHSLTAGVLALALGGFAQAAFSASSRSPGWLLFAAAAAVFALAFGRDSISKFAGGRLSTGAQKVVPFPPFALLLVLLAVLLGSVAIVLFTSEGMLPVGWIFHILSLAAFVLAIRQGYRGALGDRHGASRPFGWVPAALALLATILLAVLARTWQLESWPFGFWVDEADNGLAALQILRDSSYRPLYVSASGNAPAHFSYLVAAAFAVFGPSTMAVRIVPALFGVVAVLFAWLLFRRWLGDYIGTLAACLLAVMRYHLTFSRFGVQVIATTAFELAALYFLDRALARRRHADFGCFGLALGLGLGFYSAFRLFPLAILASLAGMFLWAAVKTGWKDAFSRHVWRIRTQWIIALVALLLSVLPVAVAVATEPTAFFARTSEVSVFVKRDEPNLSRAIWSNTLKHLQMFNVRGDGNPRHNLPGAPMLDPITGALFVLGASLALRRWRDPANAIMLVTFCVMLLAGILSLDFEAPQSLRSIGVVPPVVYFSVLPIAAVTSTVKQLFRSKRPPRASGIPMSIWKGRNAIWASTLVAGLASVAVLNLRTFFIDQQSDPRVWSSYSTAETIVARELVRTRATHDSVVSAGYDLNRTIEFLAGDVSGVIKWASIDRLPLMRQPSGRGLVMMFDPNVLSAYRDAQRIYPSAEFFEHRPPQGGTPVMYEAILSPEVLRSVQGVDASYFSGDSPSAAAVPEENLGTLKVDWTSNPPLTEPFLAQLSSTLVVKEYGDYRFTTRGDLETSLWIDEFPVSGVPVTLAVGTHAIRWQITGGAGSAELFWLPPSQTELQPVPPQNLFVPPVTNSGLLGSYYPTADWSGPPAFTQVDPQLAYYFHIIPLPRPYSVRWTGKLFAPSTGAYEFEIFSVDGSTLILDGETVLDNPEGRKSVTGSASLSQGWHDLRVDFSDRTSGTQIYLYWTPPGGTRELVPARWLSPPMGAYPTSP